MRSFPKLLTLSNIRRYSSLYIRQKISQDEDILQKIEESQFKPKKHPGINPTRLVTIPQDIISSIENTMEDFNLQNILRSSEILSRHLKGRVPPMEPEQIKEIRDKFHSAILKKEDKRKPNEIDEDKLRQRINDKLTFRLKTKIYNWKPITFDAHTSLSYLLARFAPEYAVLVKILAEIKHRDPQFVPKSMFDFGSGVGSAMWAVNHHWQPLFEYFNVDTSSFMNDLSLLLLQGGRANKKCPLRGVYYRQFFPMTHNLYDVVISAYSLLELPSVEARMETAVKLWNKTGRYLIFVEQGTNAGFRVINEIRDYLLQLKDVSNFVFSPCPHEKVCPRFMLDKTPCNFQVTYSSLPIGGKSKHMQELYSYVIIAKGTRDDSEQWPRVIRESLVRPRHTICRVCSKDGSLDEVIITASKHGKATYHCARATKWGDRLPVNIESQNKAN